MRLSERTAELVNAEARRSKRSRGVVVEALADKALRTRMFPGVALRGHDWDRRPWVIGTALDVWQIVDAHRDFGSVEEMAAGGGASELQIRLALSYYEHFTATRSTRRSSSTTNHSISSKSQYPTIATSLGGGDD